MWCPVVTQLSWTPQKLPPATLLPLPHNSYPAWETPANVKRLMRGKKKTLFKRLRMQFSGKEIAYHVQSPGIHPQHYRI